MDALVRRVFGEVQLLDAIGMHGRVAGRDVQAAGIDLGDVSQERRGRHAISGYELSRVAKKILVTEVGQRVLAHGVIRSRGGYSNGPVLGRAPWGVLLLYHE